METTIEELQQKFETLPEDLKWAIMGVNIDEKITEIGKEQGLTEEQMGQLALETTVVTFGLLNPGKFQESIQASLKLPEFRTKMIADEVEKRVLGTIKEKFMSLYKKNEDKVIENYESGINKSSDVPLPPYKKIIANKEELPKTPEVIPTPTPEQSESFVIPKPIEPAPVATNSSQNIMEEKLKGPVASEHTVSDHSTPKVHDPYHEPIE